MLYFLLMRRFIILVLACFFSIASVSAIRIEEDTMIKIAYSSPETNQHGAVLDIYVRENVFSKDRNGFKRVVIPAGTKGKLTILRVSGMRDDIITDSKGYLVLGDKKIDLKHYKSKRKGARKVLKVARYAGAATPVGAAMTAAGMGIKRARNKYNLPKKMFTVHSVSFHDIVDL